MRLLLNLDLRRERIEMSRGKSFAKAYPRTPKNEIRASMNLSLLSELMKLIPVDRRGDHAYLVSAKIRDEALVVSEKLDREIWNLSQKTDISVQKSRKSMTKKNKARADIMANLIFRNTKALNDQ